MTTEHIYRKILTIEFCTFCAWLIYQCDIFITMNEPPLIHLLLNKLHAFFTLASVFPNARFLSQDLVQDHITSSHNGTLLSCCVLQFQGFFYFYQPQQFEVFIAFSIVVCLSCFRGYPQESVFLEEGHRDNFPFMSHHINRRYSL